MIDELSALRKIEEHFKDRSKDVVVGIGDDTAALCVSEGKLLLATTDSQVENVHFQKSYISPDVLARKSVAVSVSDIGAMGGEPKYILASVGFSEDEDEEYLSHMIAGFRESEKEFGVELIGGNLSTSQNVFLDITVLGEVEPLNVVKRTGASVGDLIYISGTLGDSALGLRLLSKGSWSSKRENLVTRHLSPTPKLALGRQLSLNGCVSSMIDVSDGLLLDLGRITLDKGLGARINADKLPLSTEYREAAEEFSDEFYEFSLTGGEDYELLFTSSEDNKNAVFDAATKAGTDITEIGIVTKISNIEVVDSSGSEVTLKKRGFVHFS